MTLHTQNLNLVSFGQETSSYRIAQHNGLECILMQSDAARAKSLPDALVELHANVVKAGRSSIQQCLHATIGPDNCLSESPQLQLMSCMRSCDD